MSNENEQLIVDDTDINTPEVLQTPAVPEIVELPELSYTYQPKDESGRKLGGAQVIKYKTQDELTQKLVDQNVQLVRKLREETKKNRLGISEPSNIPDEVQRFKAPIEFKRRELSADERAKLSRDLLDPDHAQEATSVLLEAELGVKPDVLGAEFSRMSQDNLKLLAKIESEAFMTNNPSYYKCRDNFLTITDWMVKNDLAPVRENFQLAYDSLKLDGLILEKGEPMPEPIAPIVPIESVPVTEAVVPSREEISDPIRPEALPQVVPPATGLTRGQAGEATPPARAEKYTLSDINKMSGDVYKQKYLHEKGFPQLVERLMQESKDRSRR